MNKESQEYEVQEEQCTVVYNIDVNVEEVNPGDVLIVKFPAEMEYEDVVGLRDSLKEEFEGHEVVCICNDLQVMARTPKEAIELLEKMIAHIKIVA